MSYLTFMPDVLRDAGLPVREVPGWEKRGHGAMAAAVLGVLAHHTAGAATGLFPSERIVVNGRPGLAGPLCNLGLDRAGTWVVVAAGQAWHAGTGSAPWCPANQGNSRLIGVEAESVGTRDDWTAAQRQSYPRGVAALLRHLGLSASRVIGHKEWAPGRKIDPAFWDMNSFRADVARWLDQPQEGDLSAKAEQDIALLVQQLVTGPDPKAWGWPTFPGGSNDRFTVVDYLRKQNQRNEDVMRELANLRALVNEREAAGPAPGPVALTDADVARIAAAVVDLISRRTAA